jgi:hypothetical protein
MGMCLRSPGSDIIMLIEVHLGRPRGPGMSLLVPRKGEAGRLREGRGMGMV